MSQYSVGIMGFLTGGLPMLTNLFLDQRKLTFRSKIQIIFQKWAAGVLFIIGLIIIGVNPSILGISEDLAEYYCSVICCIILSMPFILNFGLRSKTSFLQEMAKVAEGKDEDDGKEMTIMFSYLFISIARSIISLLVYITYCFTQDNIQKTFFTLPSKDIVGFSSPGFQIDDSLKLFTVWIWITGLSAASSSYIAKVGLTKNREELVDTIKSWIKLSPFLVYLKIVKLDKVGFSTKISGKLKNRQSFINDCNTVIFG